MGGRQITLDLSGVAARIGSSSATQTRLNYHKGEIVFAPNQAVEVSAVPVDVNETTIIQLALSKPLAPSGELQLERFYATETAVKVTDKDHGQPAVYEISCNSHKSIKSAKLLIGIHRRGGITEPLIVEINGNPVTIDTGDSHEFSEFFAPMDAAVEPSLIKENNKISITAQPNTTITSVQLETQSSVR
jgi:agarase